MYTGSRARVPRTTRSRSCLRSLAAPRARLPSHPAVSSWCARSPSRRAWLRISRSRGRATAHDEPRDTRCWISENERLDQPDPPRATTLWRRRERRRAGRGPSLEPAHLRLRLLAQVQAPGQALRGRARGRVRFNHSAEQETVRGARVRPVRALAALDRGPRDMLRDVPRARGADRGRDRVRRAARGSLRHVVARANTVDALKDAGTPARARSAAAGRGGARRARGKLPAHTRLERTATRQSRPALPRARPAFELAGLTACRARTTRRSRHLCP